MEWLFLVKETAFYKTLLLIALPAALQSLISLSVNMLDNIMVGNLGDVALASVSLANQVTTFLAFFIKGIGGGAAVLIAQYLGKQDFARIRRIYATVLRFAFISMTIVSIIIFIFPAQTMRIFTNDLSIIADGVPYIRIICFSYILFAVSDTMISMLRWTEIVKIGVIVPFISLFTNLVFNYILIFGKLGFPALGIRGAAIATLLCRAIELTIVFVYVFKVDKKLSLTLKDLFTRSKETFSDFVRHSVPIIIGDSQWGLVGVAKAMLIGRLGVSMIAANSIADVILSLAMIFTNGLSNGACVVIGKTVGVGDYKKTRQYSNTIQILFAILGIMVAALVFSIRSIPPSYYDVSQETRDLAVQFIAIGAFTHIGTCYHAACFTGINRGAGDGKFVMKVDMICGWLIVLPLTYLCGFVLHLPLPLVYLCTRIDQCFKWIIAFFRLRGNKWIHKVTRDTEPA